MRVSVGVMVGVSVGALDPVGVSVIVGVMVGVLEPVGVGVRVFVGVGVNVWVVVGVGVRDPVGVGVIVGVFVAVEVGVGVSVGTKGLRGSSLGCVLSQVAVGVICCPSTKNVITAPAIPHPAPPDTYTVYTIPPPTACVWLVPHTSPLISAVTVIPAVGVNPGPGKTAP